MEWCSSIAGHDFRASGSFSGTAGHLSLYAAAGDGPSILLATVTWHGGAIEAIPQISAALAALGTELAEDPPVMSLVVNRDG
jgi:hypothetical protein